MLNLLGQAIEAMPSIAAAAQANRPGFSLDCDTEPNLAIETLVKAISEVEGVLSQPTPEIDISGFTDGYLHLIVRYRTLPEQAQVRRTKTRAVVAILAEGDRADIKIPQPVPVSLYDFHSSNNSASNSASNA